MTLLEGLMTIFGIGMIAGLTETFINDHRKKKLIEEVNRRRDEELMRGRKKWE